MKNDLKNITMNNILDRLEKATSISEVNAIIEKGLLDATPHAKSNLMKFKWRNIDRINRKK